MVDPNVSKVPQRNQDPSYEEELRLALERVNTAVLSLGKDGPFARLRELGLERVIQLGLQVEEVLNPKGGKAPQGTSPTYVSICQQLGDFARNVEIYLRSEIQEEAQSLIGRLKNLEELRRGEPIEEFTVETVKASFLDFMPTDPELLIQYDDGIHEVSLDSDSFVERATSAQNAIQLVQQAATTAHRLMEGKTRELYPELRQASFPQRPSDTAQGH